MRLLGLILVMVMMSESSHAKRDFNKCVDIQKEMNFQLAEYSDYYLLRSQNPTGKRDDGSFYPTDGYRSVTQMMEGLLTSATQFATIYNAKCK